MRHPRVLLRVIAPLLGLLSWCVLPLAAHAGPQDAKVGETRVLYAKTGTPLRAQPQAAAAQVLMAPGGTPVQVLEVALPWLRVRATPAGQAPVEGWVRAYQATEPENLVSTPGPAHVDDRKAAQVTQQQASMAGRQFTDEVEQGYRSANPDLSAAYAQVDALERLTAAQDPAESLEFLMDGSIGRRGRDYRLPGRLPAVPPEASRRQQGGGNVLRGPLGGLLKDGLKKVGVDDRVADLGVQIADAVVEAQVAQLRTRFNHDQEYYLGRALAAQAIAKHGVARDEGLRRYVRRVGDAMVRVSDMVPANFGGYHFEVLDSDTVNGVAGPGGYVLVTRGAVMACRTEDELAGILAHELAHITRRHAEQVLRQGARWKSSFGSFARIAASATGLGDAPYVGGLVNLFSEAVGEMARVSSEHAYGPALEMDSDLEGTKLLFDVFYDWSALRTLLQAMGHDDTARGGDMHAEPEQRARMLERQLAAWPPYPSQPGTAYERLARFNRVVGRPPPPEPVPASQPAQPAPTR